MKNVWVIAGGSQGLGRQAAKQAHASGYPVAVIGRDVRALESLELELRAAGGPKVSVHSADLGDLLTTENAFEEIRLAHGPIQVLLNCAGTWIPRVDAKSMDVDVVRRSLDLNLFTALHPTQIALRARQEGERLTVIFVGATASIRGGPQTAAFCLAKAAVRSYSQSLARELAPKGVHVAHLIIDGLIDNDRTRALNPGLSTDQFINPSSIARSILQIAEQDSSCWTHEWDIRPFLERW